MKRKMIDFLLENANPSIKLRVKKEILKTMTRQEETQLQEQILEEKSSNLFKASNWQAAG